MQPHPTSLSESTSTRGPEAPKREGKRLRKIVVVGLPLIAAGAAVIWLAQPSVQASGSMEAPPPPTVTVAPVEERLLVDRTEQIGRVVPTEMVELKPEVSGRIIQVGFHAGQLVKSGDVLFTIDAQPYAAVVELARAEVAGAKARAETAQREADRAFALGQQAAIANEEVELRQSRAAETRAALLSAQAALESAEIDLARTEVRAPIDGRISRAYVTEGNVVSANNSLLTTIVSTGEAHVHVNVDEATIHRFRAAQAAGNLPTDAAGRIPVELRLGQSDVFTHRGFVESLDNRIDAQTGSLTVRLHFDDPLDELLPGSFVRVRVPVGAAQNRLIISERAIGTDQSQKFVLTVNEDQTVAYRPVDLGPSLGDLRIIESGIAAGERIIVNGLQRVRPGMTVNATVQAGPPTSVAAR